MTKLELAEIGAHFDGTRHGGIRLPDLTAITHAVIAQTFPDAAGLAVRGSAVVVIYRECETCADRFCNHPKCQREEAFSGAEVDALILAHVRGASVSPVQGA